MEEDVTFGHDEYLEVGGQEVWGGSRREESMVDCEL